MSEIVDAQYASVWNDGETVVWSAVGVDFDEMAIVSWGDRWYEGEVPADDGHLKNLVEERVVTPFGLEYTAMSGGDYEQILSSYNGDADALAADYDSYGNGILVYDESVM